MDYKSIAYLVRDYKSLTALSSVLVTVTKAHEITNPKKSQTGKYLVYLFGNKRTFVDKARINLN